MASPNLRRALYAVFFVSGFSGLIYESLWTQYLKLFLGHAAYAQALVLAIYMGGLALGSWFSGRFIDRVDRVLTAYAAVEAVIGCLALVFHPLYGAATGGVYEVLAPAIGSPAAAHVFRFAFAGALILPQTFLLGMTFPFMSAGVLRRSPGRPGAVLSMLYFTNSLGGVGGALAGTFMLVPWLGLPGSIRLAGVLNLVVAVWVMALVDERAEPHRAPAAQPRALAVEPVRLLLAAAFVTGLSSFVYEVSWIRLLSLVLGSSTHAFEIMLSVFILGLALGGLWIRARADRLASPVRTLAYVQVLMGLAAVATLPLYVKSFEAVRWLLSEVPRSDAGYALYSLASYGVAAAVMLPATFCAGMTLPLITLTLLRGGLGERSLGAVYGANTVGAILGVFLAVFLGFEALGLKNLLVAGAAVDVVLGVILLTAVPGARRRGLAAAAAALVLAGLVLAWSVRIDPALLVSGVFRSRSKQPVPLEIVRYADGRTATVAVTVAPDGVYTLRTNGKPDASIAPPGAAFSRDEATAVLLGALPLLHRPQTRDVAVIGAGSGLTSDTALASASVSSVTTVEIEPAVLAVSEAFRPRNERLYADPRSRVVIDDAKSYFALSRRRFDAVISEPSNPWVSGIAGLFSVEFYRHARTQLAPGGLFVQWLQIYEIDAGLVASVLKALGDSFDDYVIYTSNFAGDLIIVASAGGPVPPLSPAAFADAGLAAALGRVDVAGVQDVVMRVVARKRTLAPWLAESAAPANSDFAPYLDVNANRARFLLHNAPELRELALQPLPLDALLGASPERFLRTEISRRQSLGLFGPERAVALRGLMMGRPTEGTERAVEVNRKLLAACRDGEAVAGAMNLVYGSLLYLQPAEVEPVWRKLMAEPCFKSLAAENSGWLALGHALATHDAPGMSAGARRLLAAGEGRNAAYLQPLLTAGMLGELAAGHPAAAAKLYASYGLGTRALANDFLVKLLVASAREPLGMAP
jgi:predicted membrane-bound spermidine synthase